MRDFRATITAVYEAINSGGAEDVRDLFTPEMIWHQPGQNPFSGEYVGVDQLLSVAQRVRAAAEGRFTWDVIDILAGDSYGAALVDTRDIRSEKTLREVHVYRFDETGLVAEAWSYSSDQSKSDRGLLGGVLALVQDLPDS